MSNDAYNDLQQQAVDAEIELWELELDGGNFAYFYSGLDEGLNSIQFRIRGGGSPVNTYTALPISGSGFSLKTDGALVRPTLEVANILSTFSDALAGLTNEDLLGKRIYRRRTLAKYLYPTDTSNPPIEYPVQMYYIDRISRETRLSVEFELSAAYDIAGIKLPRRVILGNGCSWKYQGAAPELIASDRIGGCVWSRHSRYTESDGTTRTVYYNKRGEQVVPNSSVITSWTSVTKNGIYRSVASTGNMRKINNDGSYTAPGTVYDYWQANFTTSSPGTASDTNDVFRRVRIYTNYSPATTYDAFTTPDYNSYVAYTLAGESFPRLFKVKNVSQPGGAHDTTPQQNGYWQLGDECAKTLDACARRFNYKSKIAISPGTGRVANVDKESERTLPFGGFPGTRIFS